MSTRDERIADLRATLATADDCRALAQRIDDEISALAMALRATYPDHAQAIARRMTDARSYVGDTMRAVGIVAEVES